MTRHCTVGLLEGRFRAAASGKFDQEGLPSVLLQDEAKALSSPGVQMLAVLRHAARTLRSLPQINLQGSRMGYRHFGA